LVTIASVFSQTVSRWVVKGKNRAVCGKR